ncbi:MAG: tripartite tricarboxylate transporter TctB family protein [Spirochaetaceae bacterium]|nr:MAG: tripartite tricarboxylate transporter TctB family protein [Spirochaetaceae bacterium]
MSSKKTLKLTPNLIFLLVVEALFAYLAVRTTRYSRVAAMMPGIIITGILLVNSALLVRELWLFKRKAGGGTVKKEQTVASPDTVLTPPQSDPKVARMRELEMVAWLAGLSITIYMLGFLIAIPIFMFFFLRVRFSTKWLTTAAITIGLEVGVYLIFVVWLQTMLYAGLISKLFVPH